MSELLAQIRQSKSEAEAVRKKVEAVDSELRKQHAKSQSGIAWVIIVTFVATVILLFGLVIFNLGDVGQCKDGAECVTKWEKPAEFLLSVISSVMLPIVTLVLGYYFGKEKSAK